MQFVDRTEELALLRRALSPANAPKFVVVYGRRRLGKSTLLRKVMGEEDVYFMAADLVEAMQIEMLQQQLARKYPAMARATFRSWEDILLMLNQVADHQFTLCLDEFPYLVKRSPSLPSLLQRVVDSKTLKYNIVICGSSQRMMQNMVLSQAEPLYGRANEIIDLQPIAATYLTDALGVDAVAAVEEHSVWGGVPRYWEIREEHPSLNEAIKRSFLSTTAPLYEEPKRLFLDDLTTSVQSESLLSVIASGARRISEIGSRMGKDTSALSAPIERLISMNYLTREIPFGENPKKSKRGLYRLKDPLMDFYYTFIVPNLSNIGRGRYGTVMDYVSERFDGYVARHWEYLCREAVSGNRLFGSRWGEAGRWWGKVPDNGQQGQPKFTEMEFDVVAESSDHTALLVGECKWTNPEMASELLAKLNDKIAHWPLAQGKKIIPVLFLKNLPKDNPQDMNLLLPADVLPLTYGD